MRSFFKFFTAIVLLILSGMSFAGGPDLAPPPPHLDRNGVYVDLSAGYATANWNHFATGALDSNTNGGFTFGFDVGYQINNIIALEVGWFDLPTIKGTSTVFLPSTSLRLESWLAYLAAKIMVPLSDHFDIFGKLGLLYRSLNWHGDVTNVSGFGDRDTNYFSGIFGAGLQYWFDENWSISVQYLHVLSHTSGGQFSEHIPSTNLIVGSVGYLFAV